MALKLSLYQNHPERFLLTCTARAHSRSTFTEHLAWSRGLGCQVSSTCDLSHETHLGTSCFDYSRSCSKHAPRSHWVNMPIVCSRSCRHLCTSSTPPVEIWPPGLLSSASAMVTVNFGLTGVASPLWRAGPLPAFGREPSAGSRGAGAGRPQQGLSQWASLLRFCPTAELRHAGPFAATIIRTDLSAALVQSASGLLRISVPHPPMPRAP